MRTLLGELVEIYDDIDNRTARFADHANLSCPRGCGTCCSNFEPDVTDIEATYLALHLLINAPVLIERLTAVMLQRSCVFYEPGAIHHCTVYPARPLVCRAFGFSATTLKDGKPHFVGCRLLAGVRDAATASGESTEYPPVMMDYGLRVSVLSSTTRSAMRTEVLRAINALSLKRRLISPPEIETPSPDSDYPPEKGGRSGAA